MSEEIKLLNEKIDFLTEQVLSVTTRLKAFDEFKEDFNLFSNDAFGELVNFMKEVDYHFRSDDLVELLKKFLRNTRTIAGMMDQMQSFTELMEDVSPLAKDMFSDIVVRFEQFEKDGIFTSIETMLKGVKRINSNFTPEDIERMGENHVRLLKLSNKLATPENLEKLERIAAEVENMDFKADKKVSMFKIFKKARSREVLRSLDLVLDIATIISRQDKKNINNNQIKEN